MKGKPNDSERLNHILEAIERILRYTDDLDLDDFLENEMVQDAVMKNFEVIGEASYHLSKEFKEKFDHIEWKKIEGLRHVLVHDYYKIDPEILWNTKAFHIEQLQSDLEEIIDEEE